MRFDGKTFFITGSGSGLGRASARGAAAEGGSVLVFDRDETTARETVALIEKDGGRAVAVAGDVSDSSSVSGAVDTAVSVFGGINAVVNSAGVDLNSPIEDTSAEDFDWVVGVNLKGSFLVSKYALPALIEAGGGSIINISSAGGLVGLTNSSVYCASKGAIIAMTRALSLDVAVHGVRVNCICPGTMDTPFTERILQRQTDPEESRVLFAQAQPITRFAQPEEVATAVLYLASDDSSYMTGSTITVDGGFTAR